MSVLLSCQNLTKAYSARPLFEDLSFGVMAGERVGLLGVNGSGKSTLLKLLAGLEKPDAGSVSVRRGLRLDYLAQEDVIRPDQTVREALHAALAEQPLDERERAGRVDAMLLRAGFAAPEEPAGTLSGGWRKRLALARELIREPDLLLLDEPTNHLDLEGVLWLETALREAPFAWVMVSHDRSLLRSAANRILELSSAYEDGCLSVNGAYDEFTARREEYLDAQERRQHALAGKVRREIEWLRQGAPARSTKANYRIREAGRLMEDLAELRLRNSQKEAAGVDFTASGRRTRDLLTAQGVEKSLGGRKLFAGLDLILSPGRRLGLLGRNGSGKTTLLRLLAGETEPDQGAIRRAEDLRIVYFDQMRERLDPEMTLRVALSPAGDTVIYRDRPMHVNAWAKRFLFRPEQLGMTLSLLSGGEQARVLIARLMLQPADLLILDEPTNDLDIPTLEVLEEGLATFPGAVVLVTHDRAMLDAVCTEFLALDGRGGAAFFADYAQWEQARQAARPAPPKSKPEAAPPPPAPRISYQEMKELSRMEERIEAAERELEKLRARMSDPEVAADHVRLQEAWQAVEEGEARVAALYARWEVLETKRGG